MSISDLAPIQFGQALKLSVSQGQIGAIVGTATFPSQVVALTANATNYVFLDLSVTPPVISVNTSGFPASNSYPIAIAVTNSKGITNLTDSRLLYNNSLGGSTITLNGPETPTGAVDGSNTNFTVAKTPTGLVQPYLNGLLQAGFSVNGKVITLASAPQPGDLLTFYYAS